MATGEEIITVEVTITGEMMATGQGVQTMLDGRIVALLLSLAI